MRKQQPDFDSRNWGYAKLSDLIRATELFLVEPRPAGGLQVQRQKEERRLIMVSTGARARELQSILIRRASSKAARPSAPR